MDAAWVAVLAALLVRERYHRMPPPAIPSHPHAGSGPNFRVNAPVMALTSSPPLAWAFQSSYPYQILRSYTLLVLSAWWGRMVAQCRPPSFALT